MNTKISGILVGAIFYSLGTSMAQAVPVEFASSTITLKCSGTTPSTQTTTEQINTGQCDVLTDTLTSQALAEGFLGDEFVFVQTFVNSEGGATTEATATINLQIRVNEDISPPAATDLVDVGTLLSGEVVLIGGGFGTVSATLTGPLHETGTVLVVGPPNFSNRRVSAQIQPNVSYDVAMRASCISVSVSTASLCTAILDPDIFLDQEAFDMRLGVDSFTLSDFYSIEVSANFGSQVVPIPSTVWLFGSGLLGLIGSSRRKKAV